MLKLEAVSSTSLLGRRFISAAKKPFDNRCLRIEFTTSVACRYSQSLKECNYGNHGL